MKVYTRQGDEGRTSIIGARVDKDDIRIEAYGTIDELNSFVGQALSLMDKKLYADLSEDLLTVQHELFDCGSDLAYADPNKSPYKVTADMTQRLEQWIDRYDEENADITRFILPGGCAVASAFHVCRTVCRRAERLVVTLGKQVQINEEVRRYINRLSDLFFVVARTSNSREGISEPAYLRSAEVFRKQS